MLRSVSFVNYDGAFQKNKMQRSKPRLIQYFRYILSGDVTLACHLL